MVVSAPDAFDFPLIVGVQSNRALQRPVLRAPPVDLFRRLRVFVEREPVVDDFKSRHRRLGRLLSFRRMIV